ncbi:hypothetical protein RA19_19505 [Leisingera sp. ANG-M1]|uniref:amidohydrolase family protein n=1 Tax=Leisingera sp. ANG-M1 TaxID=1577895 RepID=UPI000580096A|nr:amidohydrolase family protein [Leisingera sp. ANG-M1]KIC08171.1 hypothetical protein RA19_19505 [Leisingera sp. ANG-M1]
MPFSRRGFIGRCSSLALLAGCGPSLERSYGSYEVCNPPDGRELVIDAHCHLLNQKDGSARELVANRVLNLDETHTAPGLDWMVGTLAQALSSVLGVATQSARSESNQIDYELRKPLGDPHNLPARASGHDLCSFADRYQAGLIRAGRDRQITGFFSNRLRNAAQMMLLFPDVDLFLPSMVDFYEGRTRINYRNQIAFYSNLALVTRGRFLPLASFSPEREYDDRHRQGRGPRDTDSKKSQFWWLKHAITNLGFVGVKVHPSSGFSPIDNLAFGCSNRSRRYENKPDRELYDRFTAYDEYMEELLDFCKEANVPILSHGNIGLTVANKGCMTGWRPSQADTPRKRPEGLIGDPAKGEWFYPFGTAHRVPSVAEDRLETAALKGVNYRPPEDYTASPKAWIAAMEAADARAPDLPASRVIFGHFSGSFVAERDAGGTLRAVPSAWLKSTAELVRTNRNFYVDLSELSNFFSEKNGAAYAEAFKRFLAGNPQVTRQLVYGSDWHMPGTALVGKAYFGRLRSLLPKGEPRRQIMGERAADLFGLRPGTPNLERLERFFARAPDIKNNPRANPGDPDRDPSLRPEDISWWAKI